MLGWHRVGAGVLPKLWARGLCMLLLLKVEVHGRENISDVEHYVFMANHQGMLDICMLNGYLGRDFKWMMKKELDSVPVFGAACRRARFVMVDNTNAGAVRRTCREAAQLMREGYSLCLFPEGMRTWDGQMNEFHKGGFVLAQNAGFPIVPITINGSFEALPRYRGLSLVKRTPLSITIHKPIQVSGSRDELMRRTYETIHSGLELKRARV